MKNTIFVTIFLQSVSFIPFTASERLIFFNVFKVPPFDYHGNKSNSEASTKMTHLEEEYSSDISLKVMSKSDMKQQLMPIFIFPIISLWKL